MPTIFIASCKDYNNQNIEGAVVIALPQDELFQAISHTTEGQDFPTNLSFLKCNLTDAQGQCYISVPSGGHATVSFVSSRLDVGSQAVCHISLQES